jgi:hypothetical protein
MELAMLSGDGLVVPGSTRRKPCRLLDVAVPKVAIGRSRLPWRWLQHVLFGIQQSKTTQVNQQREYGHNGTAKGAYVGPAAETESDDSLFPLRNAGEAPWKGRLLIRLGVTVSKSESH